MFVMRELLRGPEPDPPSFEVMIFMGVGRTTGEGDAALRDYNHMVKNEKLLPEEALRFVISRATCLAGPIAELKDQ